MLSSPPYTYCVHAADITEFSWCHGSVPVVNSCYYTLHCQHNISWGLHDLKQAKNTNKLVIKTKGANKLLIISSIWILPLTFTYYSRQQIISFQFSVPFTADELIKFPLTRTFDSKIEWEQIFLCIEIKPLKNATLPNIDKKITQMNKLKT